MDAQAWQKQWVVHSEQVGSGEAAFKYLAPYVFRVAISNRSLLKLEAGRVTFKYKESATQQIRFCAVTAAEFIRRFLQHVLPSRFVKVRYYGLISPGNRDLLSKTGALLTAGIVASNSTDRAAPKTTEPEVSVKERTAPPCCPTCGTVLTLLRELKRKTGLPP